jgi:hypothetical protein
MKGKRDKKKKSLREEMYTLTSYFVDIGGLWG